MLDTPMLAMSGEHITVLDEHALASIAGGDGFKDWLVKKVGELLFDCLTESLDTIIAAAEEGYEDAR
ncbi:MAG TPA: hypothetical protein VJ650_01955 [Gemmatimonadaceae bacterium]|nr:hypothetical protein [Gemmatimonadaceae bacterium]